MITQETLDRLRELEAKATPGQWLFYVYRGEPGMGIIANDPLPIMVAQRVMHERDTDLIIESRNALPDLLAEIERLQALVKQYESEDEHEAMKCYVDHKELERLKAEAKEMREEHKRLWVQIMNLKERCHELEDAR